MKEYTKSAISRIDVIATNIYPTIRLLFGEYSTVHIIAEYAAIP